MANIVVTSDANAVYVDFGVYASDPNVNEDCSTYPRRTLSKVSKPHQEDYIRVIMDMSGAPEEWWVSYESVPGNPKVFIIDSVNGTAPTSLDQLKGLLEALIVA